MLFKKSNLLKSDIKILYFTASNGLGNTLIELAVLNSLYPKRKIFLITSKNNEIKNISSFGINIKVIIYPWNKMLRIIIKIIKIFIFRLTKLRIFSLIYESIDKNDNKYISEKKGILDISLVEYKSHFQITKYLENINLPIDLNLYDLKIKSIISKNEKLQFLNWSETCFVHIRRGDYLSYPCKAFPAVLEIEWYKTAIDIMRKDYKIKKFII